ncbi:DUF3299 domain-containing protein [Alteromonas sp. ASW11-36]|uniref:DUF3299 domain-containing protein n=1 Tax=Alteromonas arenosi TaxID=3055817 RepID=A0ABT7SW72_9ALTE|nr:DUF3299 domain-containing protein [Alteromonas sp. ASW11-36]MDM7860437.1 DUF3299 domain-containing protein [Alteromonas sp. ASW11-36]
MSLQAFRKFLLTSFAAFSVVLLFSFNIQAEDKVEYQTIEWIELLPIDDLNVYLNPPELLSGIEDGSSMDNMSTLNDLKDVDEDTKRFYEVLKSDRVVSELENKAIRIPGFVVPLANDENNLVTEFFVVPYFGACLHLPPPAPNQILYSKTDEGFELDSLQQPFWFEGTLKIEQSETDLGISAYRLMLDSLQLYEE